ncbi:hypothetical protein HAX54_043783, partial [Datura stramonium]|nr:hypothetical protein [Datura stramonium]
SNKESGGVNTGQNGQRQSITPATLDMTKLLTEEGWDYEALSVAVPNYVVEHIRMNQS